MPLPANLASQVHTECRPKQMIRTVNLTLSVSRSAGGLFESVRHLVQSLLQTGVNVRVFGVEDEFTEADLESWRPVDALAFKPTWPRQFGYSPRFLEQLLAFQPEIVHTHGIWVYPSVATRVYGRKRGCPYLVSTHGMLDPWAVRNSRWKKRMAYFLFEGAHLRDARCLRALCEAEARAIRQFGLKNDIVVIPNGIDLPTGPLPPCPPWNADIEPGKKVLLFLGRIHPKKGLVNLLKAWSAVAKTADHGPRTTDNGWVLAIAGWDQGGHERELQQLASELGLAWTEGLRTTNRGQRTGRAGTPNVECRMRKEASVVFLGPQFSEAKAACYHFCDAFVLPSASEGVPMAVLEAWAHSKPVVMTPECNLPLGFTAGAALRVGTEVRSIASGLAELMEMAEAERVAMGGKARALAAERFVWPRIAEEMKAVYEWILGGGSNPACLVQG